jgi:hypothetical protein
VKWAVEERFRYKPLVPVPADWQFIRYDFELDSERPYCAVYTYQVDGDCIRHREWVECRRVTQRRYVTEWADVLSSPDVSTSERLGDVAADTHAHQADGALDHAHNGADQ